MTENKPHTFSKLFLVISGVFISSLLTSNILAVKILSIKNLILPAGVIVFPISYIINDVLTEVYGYSKARTVIWLGFFANLIFVSFVFLVQHLPAAPFWELTDQFNAILGPTLRILLASFTAYIVGSFVNAYVMSILKIKTKGKYLWVRTIASTIVGEGLDSLLFVAIAFGLTLTPQTIFQMILAQWGFKTVYEIIITPVTYRVIAYVKKAEGIDTFDEDIQYNPLSL